MVVGPHPITITFNDTDNTTKKAGVKIFIRNTTKKSNLFLDDNGVQIITDSNGVSIIDLANLPIIGSSNQYDDGDVILIIGYFGLNSDAARYVVVGDDKTQTLNLNPVNFTGIVYADSTTTVSRIMHVLTANTTGNNHNCIIYAIDDGEVLAQIETPSNDTKSVQFGHFGKQAGSGFVIERENSGLLVTVTVK